MINRVLLYMLTVAVLVSGYLYIGSYVGAEKKIHNVDNALKTVNGSDEDLVKYEAEEDFLNNQIILDVIAIVVFIWVTVKFWRKTVTEKLWKKHVVKYVESTNKDVQ